MWVTTLQCASISMVSPSWGVGGRHQKTSFSFGSHSKSVSNSDQILHVIFLSSARRQIPYLFERLCTSQLVNLLGDRRRWEQTFCSLVSVGTTQRLGGILLRERNSAEYVPNIFKHLPEEKKIKMSHGCPSVMKLSLWHEVKVYPYILTEKQNQEIIISKQGSLEQALQALL